MDEQSLGGEVFLVWCMLALLVLILFCPLSMVVASPIYSGLGPLPKYEREGIPQRPDLKGDKQFSLS